MKKIVTTLQNLASGKTVLILFLLTMAVFSLMLLYTIPKVESFAPGIVLFDMSPTGYSYQQATSLLESLGEVGRNIYLFQQLPADFVYPGLFAISYSLLLTWLFAKSFEPNSKKFFLVLVPVLGGLFDYLENIGIILMINAFPNISQSLVGVVSTFTVLKSAFMLLQQVFIYCFWLELSHSSPGKIKGKYHETSIYDLALNLCPPFFVDGRLFRRHSDVN